MSRPRVALEGKDDDVASDWTRRQIEDSTVNANETVDQRRPWIECMRPLVTGAPGRGG